MTWNELVDAICRLNAMQRDQRAYMIDDLGGPEQRVLTVQFVVAKEDVYEGISVGNTRFVASGEAFLRTVQLNASLVGKPRRPTGLREAKRRRRS